MMHAILNCIKYYFFTLIPQHFVLYVHLIKPCSVSTDCRVVTAYHDLIKEKITY